MKIELRKIRINQRMSEETTCFSADVYLDGKRRGEALNRGTGGPTEIRLTSREEEERATAAARAWIMANDPEGAEYIVPKEPGGYAANPLEWLIDGLVSAEGQRKEDARTAKIEAKNAQGFAARGLPFMLRVQTATTIAWFGLKDSAADTVTRALAHAAKKYGAATTHAVLPTAGAS